MKQVPFACLKGNNSYILYINKKRQKTYNFRIKLWICKWSVTTVHKNFKLFLW